MVTALTQHRHDRDSRRHWQLFVGRNSAPCLPKNKQIIGKLIRTVGVNPHRTDGLQSIRCMSFIRALAVGVNPHRTNYALTDVMNPAVRKNVRILYKIMISQDFKVWLLHKRHKLPHSTRFQDFWACREREIWKSQCYSPAVRHLWTDREQVIGRRYRRGMSAGCAPGSSTRWWYDPRR